MNNHNNNSMNTCCTALLLTLLALLLAGKGAEATPATTASCRASTVELNSKNPEIVQAAGDLKAWAEEERITPDAVCTNQSNIKTTCTLDYVNATESSDWCLTVPDTVYLETTLILKCTNEDNQKNVFYSVRNRPACYATACYDGYDTDALESLEQATFLSLLTELQNPNSDSEWNDIDGFDTCVQLRLAITDPIVSEAVAIVAINGDADADADADAAVELNAMDVELDSVELTCKGESIQLVSSSSTAASLRGASGRNEIAEGLNKIQGLMNIDTTTGEGFEQHCETVEGNATQDQNVTATLVASCAFDYREVIATNTDAEDSVAALCHAAQGVYVEDSVSITCTSVDRDDTTNTSSITNLIVRNKPSCRSQKCNADGVLEMATIDFDRWMKLTLEKGIEQAFATAVDSAMAPILSGPQTCVIDTEEDTDDEEIVVEVGGSLLANNDGDPIPPTDECQAFSEAVGGSIQVYNEKSKFQNEILDYVKTDMREICGSPEPDVLECNFDWSTIFEGSDLSIESKGGDAEALKNACMPDGVGSSGAGQYVESSFKVSCVDIEGKELIMTNNNVPGCVGRPCTAGQAEYVFEDDYLYLGDYFVEEGYTCTTEIVSVYAPHYNPFWGTYSMDDLDSNPQFESVEVAENENEEESAAEDPHSENEEEPATDDPQSEYVAATPDRGGSILNLNSPPTESPTGGAILKGPKYGALFGPTQAPQEPEEEFVELVASSSPITRYSGITITSTLLLLLPAAVSMIL